ncbi:hypothetical protein O3P69_020858 [Scylla paramamosain]|uniref:Uncharacterized protein n=1 Tax=Scylla paramamosain TaxID=85552 RepID=A0AAW0TP30_SCYPA
MGYYNEADDGITGDSSRLPAVTRSSSVHRQQFATRPPQPGVTPVHGHRGTEIHPAAYSAMYSGQASEVLEKHCCHSRCCHGEAAVALPGLYRLSTHVITPVKVLKGMKVTETPLLPVLPATV